MKRFSKQFSTQGVSDYLYNISPLDGRYRKQTEPVRQYLCSDVLKSKLTSNDFNSIFNEFINGVYLTKWQSLNFKGFIENCNNSNITALKNGKMDGKVLLKDELSIYLQKINYNNKLLEINTKNLQLLDRNELSYKMNLLMSNNLILISFCRDMWGYISRGVFIQKTKAGEIGSSTMPHKVNPIDFENAEGNFGVANAYLSTFVEILGTTRFQGDDIEKVVVDNVGSALGYVFVSFESLNKGLPKLTVNNNI